MIFMSIKRGKRGQFYLIATLIITIIVIGITSIVNYSSTSSSIRLDEVREELKIESSYLLDYANYNDFSGTEINTLLEDFSEDYVGAKGQGKNLYFIFGDKSNFTFMGWQSSTESVSLKTSEGSENINLNEETLHTSYHSTNNNVSLTLDARDTKEFEMLEGENFYFIVSSKLEEEKHVVSN